MSIAIMITIPVYDNISKVTGAHLRIGVVYPRDIQISIPQPQFLPTGESTAKRSSQTLDGLAI